MQRFNDTLRDLCQATTNDVFATLETLGFKVTIDAGGNRYAFRPGYSLSSPMVVCHADTVVNGGNNGHDFRLDEAKNTAHSIALDDRLGIACMVHAIKHSTPLAQCAMLVCDEEEIGNSSAQVFTGHDGQPNWLVELDRRGDDVVAYDYDTPLLRSLLEHVGFDDIGRGSFSDICYLEHLGVIGFNVGVGYHFEHSDRCYANLNDTLAQIEKLEFFLAEFGSIRLAHQPSSRYDFDEYEMDVIDADVEYDDVDPYDIADDSDDDLPYWSSPNWRRSVDSTDRDDRWVIR